MRHSKGKKMEGEELPILHSFIKCNALFQQVFVEKFGDKKIFGLECGLYYIKPHSIHW